MGNLLLKTSNDKIPQKYFNKRDFIQNGDIILYRGSSIMSKAIQYFDNAFYNHTGVVWKHEESGRLFTLDMWSGGLSLVPLSRRMEGYNDFCILRPKVTASIKEKSINVELQDWDGRDIDYNTLILFRIALIKKTGIDITGLGTKKKYICSQFVQNYINNLGIIDYENIDLITPQDLLRYINIQNMEVLFDDSKK